MDYDDTALEEMLHNAHREHVYHSQREGLSVGQSSSSVSERTVRPVVEKTGRHVVERGQELDTDHAQIRTLLDRQREQTLADCQAEIKKHEFQANYDRRSIHKLSRRDQQLLHAQLLQQNSELREALNKSFNEMEELKKFQRSTFDTIARRRLVEDQDTILELNKRLKCKACNVYRADRQFNFWSVTPFGAEIHKHEFQADYDRRSTQKLNGIIESQRGEINRALAGDEQLRRDQQLFHEQFLEHNRELREAHVKKSL